ncbi:MAG: DUF2817 domain-containing protein [Candidatus Gastranaerophilales bacterium]
MIKLKSTLTKLNNEIQLLGTREHGDVLVIGVFHGDEVQGKFLIEEFIKKNPQSSLLFIPCLNPDGLLDGERTNSNGVDLNRNFPTANWVLSEKNEFFGGETPASEIETRFLIEIIEQYRPATILTLHAPFKVVNYDGDAKELAEKISKIIGYPVQENIGYPTPGSFGTYAGVERSIKTITLELDEICPVEELISKTHTILDLLL